jgi:hypothetical protein
MDVSREVGEGYQEIRTWFYNLLRLRLKEYCPGHLKWGQLLDPSSVNGHLSDLRQTVFARLKETTQRIEWTSPMPTK